MKGLPTPWGSSCSLKSLCRVRGRCQTRKDTALCWEHRPADTPGPVSKLRRAGLIKGDRCPHGPVWGAADDVQVQLPRPGSWQVPHRTRVILRSRAPDLSFTDVWRGVPTPFPHQPCPLWNAVYPVQGLLGRHSITLENTCTYKYTDSTVPQLGRTKES